MELKTFVRAVLLAPPPLPLATRIIRFLAIGTIGLATDLAVYTALFSVLPQAPICRMISLIIATYVTWQLNRWLTFGASIGRARSEMLRYCATALIAQGFNYGLFLLLRAVEPRMPDQALIVFCAALAAILSFAGQNVFTFRPERI